MDQFGLHTPWTLGLGQRDDPWEIERSTEIERESSSNIYTHKDLRRRKGSGLGFRGFGAYAWSSMGPLCCRATSSLGSHWKWLSAFGFSVLICLYVDTFLLKLCCRTRLGGHFMDHGSWIPWNLDESQKSPVKLSVSPDQATSVGVKRDETRRDWSVGCFK